MPELPEVETVLRGLKPQLKDLKINNVIIRQKKLRWVIPEDLTKKITNKTIKTIKRRGKYLLVSFDNGTLILHLGMSGSLRIVKKEEILKKHDHIDFVLSNDLILRYNDPRRFGACLWTEENILLHPLLNSLGAEPLSNDFTADYLYIKSRKRRTAIKQFIMNSKIVVGVGNIYAQEALFLAKIHPLKPAEDITLEEYECLVKVIKDVLELAIEKGGTTLKDFVNSEGKPGYFSQKLNVYARAGQKCNRCNYILKTSRIGQRSSVFCENCQVLN